MAWLNEWEQNQEYNKQQQKKLEEANVCMNNILLKFKSKRPDETSYEVYRKDTGTYCGLIKWFPANKKFKAYGNIKAHFNMNVYKYHKLIEELVIEEILLGE